MQEFLLNEKEIQVIQEILKNGNDAVVRRKGSGVIILEEKKKIKYSAP